MRLGLKAIEQSYKLENLLKTAGAMETADEHTQEIEKQQLNVVKRTRSKGKVIGRKPSLKPPDTRNTKCALYPLEYTHTTIAFQGRLKDVQKVDSSIILPEYAVRARS